MSDIFDIPAAANNARLIGYRDGYLDQGSDNARLELYTTARPGTPGGPAGDDPAVVIILAKPSGTIVSNQLRLAMDYPGGYMAITGGDLVWGRLVSGDDLWAGDGDVSDEAGDGVFKLAGDGVTVFAGGYVVLGTTALE